MSRLVGRNVLTASSLQTLPPPQKICMQMKIGLWYIDSLNGQLIVEPFEKMKMTNVCQEHWLV